MGRLALHVMALRFGQKVGRNRPEVSELLVHTFKRRLRNFLMANAEARG
jgi:hypothetical protein